MRLPPAYFKRGTPFARATSLLLFAACIAGSNDSAATEFSDLSLEELANMPVIESSKSTFKLFDAPNGAFVFNEEAIDNLPVDSIPEMLRYAPGTHIMRTSNGAWGLGIRGMNSRFLGRALFTVDEQSQYGTIFNGLFGSDHDLLLDDVASVEVVYGPGGTLWGTNAANGRVNVILKSVFETEGTAVKSRVGNLNRSIEGRHGWLIDEDSGMRVWSKHTERQSSSDDFDDSWATNRTGIRYEKRPSSENLFSVTAEAFDSDLGYSRTVIDPETGLLKDFNEPELQSGFTAQLKWTQEEDKNNGYSIRSWIGKSDFRSAYTNYDLGLFGLELRSTYSPSDRHQFAFASGIVADDENLIDSENTTFIDGYLKRNTTAHMGGEYTLKLQPQNIEASVGLSGSYDSYTDSVELLPSARILFKPNEYSRAWIAYSSSSRAIPSGIASIKALNNSYRYMPALTIPTVVGTFVIDKQAIEITWQDKKISKERLDAIEIGYRRQYPRGGSFAITSFVNRYGNVMGFKDFGNTPKLAVESPYLLSRVVLDNVANGVSYGMEFSRDWVISDQQRVVFNSSLIADNFEVLGTYSGQLNSLPILVSEVEGIGNNVPQHASSLWYSHEVEDWRFDIGLRYNSSFSSNRSMQEESLQSDLRVTWTKLEHTRVSLVGRNLFDSESNESGLKTYIGDGSPIKREAYIELNFDF